MFAKEKKYRPQLRCLEGEGAVWLVSTLFAMQPDTFSDVQTGCMSS